VNNLSVLNLNAQGLKSQTKYNLFSDFVQKLTVKPDLIVIVEHWLDKHQVETFFIQGFKLLTWYGRSKRERGGSLILINEKLKCKTSRMRIASVEFLFEICGASIEMNNYKFYVTALYRPSNPESNRNVDKFFINLENFLEKHKLDRNMMLIGDLNIDLTESKLNSGNAKKLVDILKTYDLTLVNKNCVTRRPENDSGSLGTLIDHIFTNICVKNEYQTVDICFSDHNAVLAKFYLQKVINRDTFKMVRIFNDENYVYFYNLLSLELWNDLYNPQIDIDERSKLFMNKLVNYFNESFPLKKITQRVNQQNKVNLSFETQQMKSTLISLNDSIKKERDDATRSNLIRKRRLLKKQLSSSINKEVKAVNDRKINQSSNKSKSAWNVIKGNTGKNKIKSNIESLKINGIPDIIKFNIANALNQSFVVPPPNEENLNQQYDLQPPVIDHPFVLSPTNEAEVYSVICKLTTKKSSGWDEISTETLKRICIPILVPFTYLINVSFADGKFPKNMKLSKITALHKKGDEDEASNYRPISITSSLSKVYEKIFLSRLESHIILNNLLTSHQHGFQKGKSTVTALYEIVDQFFTSIEAKEKLNVILYDFSNAFGTICPSLLIQKLKIYGLCDRSLSWLTSFLTEREQYVQIREFDCDRMEICINSEIIVSNMGVPQGTIMGPFSFVTYITDAPLRLLLAILIFFADDTSALIRGISYKDVNQKTVETNEKFQAFSHDNFLQINASKTKIMQIHTHQTQNIIPPVVALDNEIIEIVNSSKLLGVMITDTVNWQEQCDRVANKLRSVTYLFTMLREKVSESVLKQIYYAYAQSHILYSIIIWGASPHMESVFIAQKRVLRAMAGLRYWRSNRALESCRPLFKKYEILTVYSLYILECMKYLKKYPEKFKKKSEMPLSNVPITRNSQENQCYNDLYVKP
jgi:hypothetical protein